LKEFYSDDETNVYQDCDILLRMAYLKCVEEETLTEECLDATYTNTLFEDMDQNQIGCSFPYGDSSEIDIEYFYEQWLLHKNEDTDEAQFRAVFKDMGLNGPQVDLYYSQLEE
jgi:hypothetical protein